MTLDRTVQYGRMLYALWLGCRFEGEALSEWENLVHEHAETYGTPRNPELFIQLGKVGA